MESLYIFVDGSDDRRGEIHSGITVIFRNKIILESYNKTVNDNHIEDSHEQFALLNGLKVAKELNIPNAEINIYSDAKYLIGLIKNETKRKKCVPYENEIKQLLLSLSNDVNFNWCRESDSFLLKRSHNISQKWKKQVIPLNVNYIHTEHFLSLNNLDLNRSLKSKVRNKKKKSIINKCTLFKMPRRLG